MKFRGQYNFLSNFFPCGVMFEGKWYQTSEHAYQAAKFSDPKIAEEIRGCSTPGKTKKLARRYKSNIRADWDERKTLVMYDILREKFKNPSMRKRLLEIDEPIVEENEWGDTFWGVCDGVGKNNLGKILMRIKQEIYVFDLD